MTEAERHQDLREMQDAIYREKVARARSMTVGERLGEAFELTDEIFERMFAGAMAQIGSTNPEEGWREVRDRLDRLRAFHERGRYADERPGAGPA
ncbi:hypothetical protein BH23VER1_BH23VER1_22070 [soil metagenome]